MKRWITILLFLLNLPFSYSQQALKLISHQKETAQMPIIHQVIVKDSIIEQYAKWECLVELSAAYDNPYDYDQVQLVAIFNGPNGQSHTVDGFYMQDFELDTSSGAITVLGNGGFKIRFAPLQIGTWTFQIQLTDANGTVSSEVQSIACIASTNKGFARLGTTNYLELDNGEQLILVGENMAWPNNNPYIDYKNWLTRLSENGGNYFRLWHAHWGLGIEWKAGWEDFEGLRRYNERHSFYQDWLYDYCAEKGIYIMLALQHHGPFSSNVDSNWEDNPYNTINGGPCQNTWDFFSHPSAIAHTKNRYRYILARWGYAQSILSWELFNEVDWTDNFDSHQSTVQAWHLDMAAYLKTNDPNEHLVTTSYAKESNDPSVWANPDIDYSQTHYYLNTANIERALVGGIQKYLTDFDKPTLTGEFGLGSNPDLSNTDADGIHLHNALWASLLGGGMGTAMSWWWDVYVHPRDLYHHFAPLRELADQIPFVAANMRPTLSYITGAPGDLVLSPNLGWGEIGSENITINENGTSDPSSPNLSQYLYGSEWNTQYRSPPTFYVDFPEAGEFRVRTNTELGTNPRISIYLGGSLVLNEPAQTNRSYTIAIPPGTHQVKVDNLGTDWVSISSYRFTGIGSRVDAYTLISEDQQMAAGWLLNHQYNHQFLAENGSPDPINGAQVLIDGFSDGDYFVKWHDCLTGAIIATAPVSAVNNQLQLNIPELYWDLAFRVDEEEEMVDIAEVQKAEAMRIFPNPAVAGGELTLQWPTDDVREVKGVLLDASGRVVKKLEVADNRLSIPNHLSSGFYWLRLQYQDRVLTKGMVIE